MTPRAPTIRLVLAAILLLPAHAAAQSVRIFGASPEAQECFDTATNVVAFGGGSASARIPCTLALQSPKLSEEHRAATLVNRGVLSIAIEDYDGALADFEAAEKLHSRYGAIYLNRGNVLFLRSQYAAAIAEYARALDGQMGQRQIVYLNRGMAYEKLGQWEAAEDDYRKAQALAPGWELAASKLARLNSKRR